MTFDFSLANHHVMSLVQLYNAKGELLIQEVVDKGNDKIKLPKLKKGEYTVKVSNKLQKSSTIIYIK